MIYTRTSFTKQKKNTSKKYLQVRAEHDRAIAKFVGSKSVAKKTKWIYDDLKYDTYNVTPVSNIIPTTNNGTIKAPNVYDGERTLLGIAVVHKSCLVPVFDRKSAEEIAKMRRG